MKQDANLPDCIPVQAEEECHFNFMHTSNGDANYEAITLGLDFANNKQVLIKRPKYEEPAQLEQEEEMPEEETALELKDENENVPDEKKEYKWDIVWINVFLLGTLHLLAVYGFYIKMTSPRMITLPDCLAKLMAVASTIGITAGAHRLWTHRAYKANTALQIILMCFATLTYQNSVYIWARDHRLHHKCSETDGDPHNAKRGFFFSHVGWLLLRKHPEVIKQGKSIDMSDLKANKIVMFQHKYYYPLVFIGAVIVPGCFGRYFGLTWPQTIFGMIIYKYIASVNLTWCINSLAHLYGNRPYDKNIGPTESGLMRFCGMGEGFHNYHHTFPWDYKAAEFSNDSRNWTTCFIDFFAKLGWATHLRQASPEMIEKRIERTGGPGREYHMLKNSPTRRLHNIVSFLIVCFYLYVM